jgi:hypothetical protein
MNSDLGELLREGIDRATAGEKFHLSLAGRARQRHHRRMLTIRATAVTGIGAVAAAAVFTATISAGGTPQPAGVGAGATPRASHSSGTTVRLDAATVLDRAAKAALTGPSPRDNQFLYTDIRAVNPGHGKAWSYRQQTWQSVDGRQLGARRDTTCFPGLPARDNLATCLAKIPAGEGGPLNVTYAWARSLPTSPAGLLRYLEHHNNCAGPNRFGMHVTRSTAAFSEIYTILNSLYVLPRRPGAALFRAASMIPGVTVLPQVTDAAGGRGIGVAITGLLGRAGPFRFELIFDPRTYRFIGLQNVSLTSGTGQVAGRVNHAETVVSTRVVNTAPTRYTKIKSSPLTEGGVPTCISGV